MCIKKIASANQEDYKIKANYHFQKYRPFHILNTLSEAVSCRARSFQAPQTLLLADRVLLRPPLQHRVKMEKGLNLFVSDDCN